MTSQSPPAGWYPDPQNPAQQRYWDGVAWTEAVQYAPPGAYAPPGGYGPPMAQVGYGYAGAGPAPNNYLAFAILTTLFCCLPAGIVSIVKASQVNSKWNGGDFDGAREASRQARTWALVSAIVGVAVIVIVIAAGGFSSDSSSGL